MTHSYFAQKPIIFCSQDLPPRRHVGSIAINLGRLFPQIRWRKKTARPWRAPCCTDTFTEFVFWIFFQIAPVQWRHWDSKNKNGGVFFFGDGFLATIFFWGAAIDLYHCFVFWELDLFNFAIRYGKKGRVPPSRVQLHFGKVSWPDSVVARNHAPAVEVVYHIDKALYITGWVFFFVNSMT